MELGARGFLTDANVSGIITLGRRAATAAAPMADALCEMMVIENLCAETFAGLLMTRGHCWGMANEGSGDNRGGGYLYDTCIMHITLGFMGLNWFGFMQCMQRKKKTLANGHAVSGNQ